VIRRRGGDADLGPKLYGLCVDAGLDAVKTRVIQPVHGGAEPEKALALTTLVNIGDALVAEKLATQDDVDEVVRALAAFTEDPRTIIGLPRVFQVWGRRPAN
jgi:hypothetical protein